MTKAKSKKLPLTDVVLHPATQSRVEMNQSVIDDYAERLQEDPDALPPVIVFRNEGEPAYAGDGWHRHHAHKKAGKKTIPVDIRPGGLREAILYSVGANATHGLRRTNADKRRAVETLLNDAEWSQWSDREIARKCGVHHELVGKVRSELSGGNRQIEEPRKVRRGDSEYVQNTGNIGQRESGSVTFTRGVIAELELAGYQEHADHLRGVLDQDPAKAHLRAKVLERILSEVNAGNTQHADVLAAALDRDVNEALRLLESLQILETSLLGDRQCELQGSNTMDHASPAEEAPEEQSEGKPQNDDGYHPQKAFIRRVIARLRDCGEAFWAALLTEELENPLASDDAASQEVLLDRANLLHHACREWEEGRKARAREAFDAMSTDLEEAWEVVESWNKRPQADKTQAEPAGDEDGDTEESFNSFFPGEFIPPEDEEEPVEDPDAEETGWQTTGDYAEDHQAETSAEKPGRIQPAEEEPTPPAGEAQLIDRLPGGPMPGLDPAEDLVNPEGGALPSGKRIPRRLKETFQNRTLFRSILRQLDSTYKNIEDLSRNQAGGKVLDYLALGPDYRSLRGAVEDAMPYDLCPYCNGKGCPHCRDLGWLTKGAHALAMRKLAQEGRP